MRCLFVLVMVAACGGRAARTTLPTPAVALAHDLAAAKTAAKPTDAHLVAKDPRIVDLDIIRITAMSRGVGGDPELDHVATADLFNQATEAAKAGQTERAIGLYRRIVSEFSD